VFAGTAQIRRWLALMLGRPAGNATDMHDAFLTTLVRARVCEVVAAAPGWTRGSPTPRACCRRWTPCCSGVPVADLDAAFATAFGWAVEAAGAISA
jgi:hypothetical protein